VTVPHSEALRPARWWDIEAMAAIDRAQFGCDAWSVELFWSELAGIPDRRWYQVAVDTVDPLGTVDTVDPLGTVDPCDTVDPADSILGYVGLAVAGTTGDVQTIAVRPDAVGQGWGALLLDQLLCEARRRGCEEVMLEQRADNVRAFRLYESRGFERIAVRPRYYADGTDALILRHVC
jgi:ribosomal-protein-alanine N-acetyltransferase